VDECKFLPLALLHVDHRRHPHLELVNRPVSNQRLLVLILGLADVDLAEHLPELYRRKQNLKAEVESIVSHFSFKRLVPGSFNLGLIGSTCTALPSQVSCCVMVLVVDAPRGTMVLPPELSAKDPCKQGLTLIRFSAQPEPFLPQNTP
jgi:hypothetical protein